MRHYSHYKGAESEAEIAAAAAEFDATFQQEMEADPEGALLRGEWKRGIDRRSYGRRNGARKPRATYDLKQLWADHHTILDLRIAGLSKKQVAETMGCTPMKVSFTEHSTLGQAKLAAAQLLRDQKTVDVIEEVTRMLPKALAVYEEILDGDATLALKKATADTLLMKLGGYESPKRIDVRSANVTLRAEELAELRERGLAVAREMGVVVERPVPKEGGDVEAGGE